MRTRRAGAAGHDSGMTENVLEAHHLTKQFSAPDGGEATTVLRGISLSIAAGEFVAIVGPSGSGKSTLLYCLSGLEQVTSGQVTVMGKPMTGLSQRAQADIRRSHIGFVFQSYNLIRSLNVFENVALPARLSGRPISAEQVERVLHQVGLGERASYRPAALSGGQQQRVAIARVLAARQAITFADEPTGALDTEAGSRVLGMLRSVAEEGSAVAMVTHDLQAAARADRVLVLKDGVIDSTLWRPRAEDIFEALTHASRVAA
ncbi:ABC transporter ATP-binding protein [Micromonospora sp. CA-240977]|uniref:ABC transporter ATP-binding protein n=1 Tax=Micromonospora sp. CA-240977 TaxID=3239957 RepID=UPI003D8B73C6